MKQILAVDMGGTKTSAGVFDYDGEMLVCDTILNPKTMDEEVLWEAVTDLIDKVSAPYEDDIVVCGVAAAGPMKAKGKTISPANAHAWVDFPFRERLEKHIKKPAYIENDCKALALGEGWKGAAVGQSHYMSMVVSTGVGGGIVLDGKLLHGNEMQAGHIGHMIIDPSGPQCGCGGHGCVEAFASGPSLERKFSIKPEEATHEMKQFCADIIGQAIAGVTALLDIRLVTIGGSVALGFGEEYFEMVQKRIDDLAKIEFARGVKVVPSGLGKHGGLVSAARVGKLGYRGILWSE
ncbi:MAG: ROK family protein [Acidimicrobiia bacterium]